MQRQKTLQYSGDPFAIFQDYLIGATMWHLISYDKIMKKLEKCVPEYLDILDYLSTKNCISFVASHDKELTDGWNDSYVNYHFSEDIGEEDIVFDYLYRRISKRLYLQKYCQSLGKKVER